MLQLAVYAAMQIPVGVVLDRFGTRRLVAARRASSWRSASSPLLSPTASAWRCSRACLVGMGDAMTFISVLRLVGLWFAPGHIPVVTQLTGILGQLGQVAAALPLVALLRGAGWSSTFVGAAALSGARCGVVVLAAAQRRAAGVAVTTPVVDLKVVRRDLLAAWDELGHAARSVDPLRHAVLRHRVRAALGLSRSSSAASTSARRRPAPCSW